jgi:ribosome-associated protein
MIRVTQGIALEDREIVEHFVRAMGPGGQNNRREATAVELRLNIGASSIPPVMKDRLRVLAGRGVKADGVLVIVKEIARRRQAVARPAKRRVAPTAE